ncbi:Luc7-like protein 3 [Chamberlinius hualienensis]
MAAAAASQLLDELMGRDRNLNPAEKKRELRWDDPQVCKYFMAKFCPNELFINTRADLGPCDKIHDEFMKQEYEKSTSYQRMGYEEDFIKFCQTMLADVERRIRRGKQRLALGNQEAQAPNNNPGSGQVQVNDDQIKILSERINGLLEQVESLGCEGKVEEAQGIMKLCDQLKEERENLRRANENSHWLQTAEIAAAQEKQMEVCEVCGAFLIVGDAQQRVDDHLMGKQHMGYARLKIALEEMLKEKEEREKQREKDREERMLKRKEEENEKNKKREEERRKERKRSRSRSRGHKRSRSRDRKRSRSSSRSRDRRRSRSRNRSSRKHSSYGKDRRRSRSRSRGRSSRKYKRSRSRSRSRDKHRSGGDKRKDRDRDSRRSSDREKDKSKKSLSPKDNDRSASEDKQLKNTKEPEEGDFHSNVQSNGSDRNGVSDGSGEAKMNGTAVSEGD